MNDSVKNRLKKDIDKFHLIQETKKSSLARKKEINNIVKEKRVDIILTNTKKDMFLVKEIFLFKKKKPLLISTFHNSLAWANTKKVKWLSKGIKYCSDGCICMSKLAYDQLLNYKLDKCRLLYLRNTLNAEDFIKKDNYSLDNDNIQVCYTGVVHDFKNQLFTIKIINAIKDKYLVKVNFYGDIIDNDYFNLIQQEIKKNKLQNYVYFHGRVDNDILKKSLHKNDLYLSSSKSEMSPINIREAQASGLPILAADTVGTNDIIINGENGLLYEPNNIDDAVNKLVTLIENEELRKKVANTSFKEITTTQSVKEKSKKLEHFIKSIKQNFR